MIERKLGIKINTYLYLPTIIIIGKETLHIYKNVSVRDIEYNGTEVQGFPVFCFTGKRSKFISQIKVCDIPTDTLFKIHEILYKKEQTKINQ